MNRLQFHAERPEYLWADAICINQDDVSEKTFQVANMGRIFRNAGQVFAWLGLEGADSALVMNNFKHQVGIMHWVDCEIESYRIWMATQAFFDRPYWKRSWVLQELMPAKGEITVFCGADTLSYKYIHSLHREMYKKMQNGQEYRYEDCECTGPNGRLRYCRRDLILEAAAAVCGRTLPLVMTKHNEHRGRPDTLRDLLYKYRDTKCRILVTKSSRS